MKVLLPTDGSEMADKMLTWAAETLNANTTEATLLTVIATPAEVAGEPYEVEDALAVLERGKALLQQKGFASLKTEYVRGDTVEAICQVAETGGYDLVVLGSHGRTGLGKVLLGSVSQGVLARCVQPVLVCRNFVLPSSHSVTLSNKMFAT